MMRPAVSLRIVAVCGLAAFASHVCAGELAGLVETGQRRAAIERIEAGADVNEAQGDGTTPLHWAAYRVDAELTQLLLEHGAEADVLNAYGASPLGEAVKVANEEIAGLLLEAGADATATNADGQTILMLATRSGSTAIARRLIEHGANVNAREAWRGQSALMWAADSGFPEIVELLIANGAEVDFRAEWIDWPTQITSEPRAQYRPVGGLTPLLYAARAGCTDCVRAIVAAGADIDRPTPEGMTPLILALDNEAMETAAALLELGADPRIWDWYGRTPLYLAADKSNVGRGGGRGGRGGGDNAGSLTGLDLMQRLLEAGVDPNPQLVMHRPSRGGNMGRFSDDLLTTGCTPLLRAAVSGDIEAIELLLSYGARVDVANVMGVTPLMVAAGMGGGRGAGFGGEDRALAMIDTLLAAGADINARVVEDFGLTGKIGRDTNSMRGREGQTALFAAVNRGWGRVVTTLIEQSARIDVVDANGNAIAAQLEALLAEED